MPPLRGQHSLCPSSARPVLGAFFCIASPCTLPRCTITKAMARERCTPLLVQGGFGTQHADTFGRHCRAPSLHLQTMPIYRCTVGDAYGGTPWHNRYGPCTAPCARLLGTTAATATPLLLQPMPTAILRPIAAISFHYTSYSPPLSIMWRMLPLCRVYSFNMGRWKALSV